MGLPDLSWKMLENLSTWHLLRHNAIDSGTQNNLARRCSRRIFGLLISGVNRMCIPAAEWRLLCRLRGEGVIGSSDLTVL